MRELLAFGRFEVGRLLRSWKFLLITVGFPVTFYMLFLSDRRAGEVVAGTVVWRVYLMVSMCSFGALVAGLTAAGSRLSAERSSGWAYVATKVAASMLVVLPVVVLVEVVGATFGGVELGAGTWIGLTLLMWVAALPFAVLGVFIGFMVHAETAFPVVTGLMFVLGYFGGLFNPVKSMPGPLRYAAQVLPSFHHAAIGLSLLGGQGVNPTDWLVLGGYTAVLAALIMAKHRREESRGIA